MDYKYKTVGLLVGLFASSILWANIHDAEQLRQRIIAPQQFIEPVSKSIVLPVSRGFDQQETCLCWSYAFFNALETLYLVQHPNAHLEISRGAMQYFNLQDRIDLKIAGVEDHLDPKVYKTCWAEGGTPLSAAYILKSYGGVSYNEYHDIISPPKYSEMYYSIFTSSHTPKQQHNVADSLLPIYFGAEVPETTTYNGEVMSRLEFAHRILPEGQWVTYAPSKDGSEYVAKGLDPDARRNEQTHFVSRDHFIQKIHQSLAKGRPVLYSNSHHVVLIYGADYDKQGKPLSFYMKDSYEQLGYFYKAEHSKALDEIMEMTILE